MFRTIARRLGRRADLVDALLECHGQTRVFSMLAVSIGERTHAPAVEIADGCARVHDYFVEAFPLHVQDEEGCILPRLRRQSASLDAALGQMHEQHALHTELVERMCGSAASLRRDPDDARARAVLLAVARPLAAVLEQHMEVEETILFPAIRRMLSRADQSAALDELRARPRVHSQR